MKKELEELTKELVEATKDRDAYEIVYEFEKARMYFSAEVNMLSNQVMRDNQVTIIMTANGMYREMAEKRTRAKIAWYKWSAIKSLVDGKATND